MIGAYPALHRLRSAHRAHCRASCDCGRSVFGRVISAVAGLDLIAELTLFIHSVEDFQRGPGRVHKCTDVANMMRSLTKRLGMTHCFPKSILTSMIAYPK